MRLLAVSLLAATACCGHGAPEIVAVDVLDRVFPDARPTGKAVAPADVPRGGSAFFQFALCSDAKADCVIRLSPATGPDGAALAAPATLHRLAPVHVEANNQGGMKTSVGGTPPPEWLPFLLRKAPFDVCEVLVPASSFGVEPGRTEALLAEVRVPPDARPGHYTGALVAELSGQTARAPFALRVHETALPTRPSLSSVHWLDPQPANLVSGASPAWWSEAHWALLENAGRVLREFGDDSIFTPLINYRSPLIQTVRRKDGSLRFDFTRFDRWVETFSRLGFAHFMGQHIARLPQVWGGVYVQEEGAGRSSPLLANSNDTEAWLKFLPTFCDSLSRHLAEKGWTQRYCQHLLDEPRDPALYMRLSALLREHLPGVRSIDAINSQPRNFSPLVDLHVFNLVTLVQCQSALVNERRQQGRGTWLYHCASPYPPYPNRHLDAALAESRLYPWLCHMLRADGFLFWAANMYRGADEYHTSIGPLPNGSQKPGHPPGDNWMYYRGPDGLRPSLRMVAFREGLTDHTLLTELAEKDRAAAQSIMAGIARSCTDYARDPAAYHAARKLLLDALDKRADKAEK